MYGDVEFQADWWPEQLCHWSDLSKNILDYNVREFPGRKTSTEVLKAAVNNLLMASNIDPETWVVREFTMEERRRRMARRGQYFEREIDVPDDDSIEDNDESGKNVWISYQLNTRASHFRYLHNPSQTQSKITLEAW